MPEQQRIQWLEFDKSSFATEWEAMESFLEIVHDRATETKILLSNYAANDIKKENDSNVKCRKCNKMGHKQFNCPNVSAAAAKVTKPTNCPLCNEPHTYKRKKDNQEANADRFSACEAFRNMNEKDRGDLLEKHSACARCTSWLHKKDSKEFSSCDLFSFATLY